MLDPEMDRPAVQGRVESYFELENGSTADYQPELLWEWANFYMRRGWPLLPVHTTEFGHCTCRNGKHCSNPGKHPEKPERFARGLQ